MQPGSDFFVRPRELDTCLGQRATAPEECVSEISSVHHAKRCHERGGSLKRRGRGAASAFIAVAAAATHHRRRRRPPRSSSPPSPASHGRRSLSPMQLFRIASSRPLAATSSSSPPDLIRHHLLVAATRHSGRQLFAAATENSIEPKMYYKNEPEKHSNKAHE